MKYPCYGFEGTDNWDCDRKEMLMRFLHYQDRSNNVVDSIIQFFKIYEKRFSATDIMNIINNLQEIMYNKMIF